MSQVKIKICGLTRVEDVKAVVAAGVNAIGFVFTDSPRRISAQQAVQLSRYIPDGVLRVGLFLNQPRTEIEEVLNAVALDVLQFHGSESEQDCSNRPNRQSVIIPPRWVYCSTAIRLINPVAAAMYLTGLCRNR